MSAATIVLLSAGALALGLAGGWWLPPHGRRPAARRPQGPRRILLPFTGTSISRRALEAAVRLARAEDATIMPAFLARVPRHLPLDAPLPAQCLQAMPLLEAIEQKLVAEGISVDARVGRGRSYRHALSNVLADEPVDRIIVSATSNPRTGLDARDLDWLLTEVPSEVMILRPGSQDDRTVSADALRGHF